jgi:hypothetical protein
VTHSVMSSPHRYEPATSRMSGRCCAGCVRGGGSRSGHHDRVSIAICPSCGHRGTADPCLPDPPFPASRECWWNYLELASYTIERARPDFLHQEAVDAFAAQHPGPPAKPITLWFGLIGLHLALDNGMTGRAVQQAQMRLARKTTPFLTPPPSLVTMTAADVLNHQPGDERDAAVLTWARAVWSLWHLQHAPRLSDLRRTRPLVPRSAAVLVLNNDIQPVRSGSGGDGRTL